MKCAAKFVSTLFNKRTMILLLLVLGSFQVHATRYRHGTISWSRVNTTTRTITVKVEMAYRWSAYNQPSVGTVVPIGLGLNLQFGDGTSVPISLTVTYANSPEDWFTGTFTTTHTYAGNATEFTLSYSSCCRLTFLQNNASGNYASESKVNLVAGNLGSPRSTLLPVYYLYPGESSNSPTNIIQAPTTNPNGDILTYSTPTFSQTSATNPSFFNISPTGRMTIDTTGLVDGQLWQAAYVITNSYGSTTVVDFIIKIINPIFYFTPNNPTNDAILRVMPGETLNFTLEAKDAPTNTITLTTAGLPTANITFSTPLPATGNPVRTNVSFTPSASQVGVYEVFGIGTNNFGSQIFTKFAIIVGEPSPTFVSPTRSEGSRTVIQGYVLNTDTISVTNPSSPGVGVQITSANIPNGATLSTALPTPRSTNPTIQMSWTPQAQNFGPNNISFLATDAYGNTATRNYVLEVNTVPTFFLPLNGNLLISGCSTFNRAIEVRDPDIFYGDELEITATGLPSWLTMTRIGDSITLNGTPTTIDAGTYPIVISAKDRYYQSTGTTTMSFTLIVLGTPAIFTQVNPICIGAPLAPLPTVSNNGIPGSWTPALNRFATTTYTFRPQNSTCPAARMTITVNPITTNGSVTTSICSGQSYRWPANGITYTTSQSGVTMISGCNIATLNLTVIPSTTTGSVTTTACGSYTWPANGMTYTTSQSGITVISGCNTATLNLTMDSDIQTFYADADADGFGNASSALISCSGLPANASANSADCNDLLAGVNPNASEILGNGIDDNCNGTIDEITPLSYLIPSNCGVTLANLANTLFAQPISGAQGYRFRVTNGTNVRTIDTNSSSFALSNLSGGAQYNTPYTIDVAVKWNGYYGSYGSSCIINTPAFPPPTSISNPVCGSTLNNIAATIFCTANPSASAYRFRVRNGNAILGTIDTAVNRFSLASFAGIQFRTTYSVEVLLQFAGIWRPDTEYGPACVITTPATPEPSRIVEPACGSSISSFWTTLFAQQVMGAQGYKFVVSDGVQTREYATTNSRFQLRLLPGGATANTTYTIRVDVLFGGSYVAGQQTCQITTLPTASRYTQNDFMIFDAKVTPNPFSSHFEINLETSDESPVQLRVYDMLGREIESRVERLEVLNHLEIGDSYPVGVYNLILSQGEQIKILRVVKR